MYIILSRKTQGTPFPYPTNCLIKKFVSEFSGVNNCIIACPGYMSTSKEKIKKFCSEFQEMLPNTQISFTTGQNGNNKINGGETTIIDEHIKHLRINKIDLSKDHSKIIFFINNDNGSIINNNGLVQSGNLSADKINAVLFGSSNLSWTTYFNDAKPADKGEFDALLIDEKLFNNDDNKILAFYKELSDEYYKNRQEKGAFILSKELGWKINLLDYWLEFINK